MRSRQRTPPAARWTRRWLGTRRWPGAGEWPGAGGWPGAGISPGAGGWQRGVSPGTALSLLFHGLAILAIAIAAHRTLRVAPYKLPGTARGVTLLTYYSPGAAQPSIAASTLTRKRASNSRSRARNLSLHPAPAVPAALRPADPGTAAASQSGMGEGDVRIALLQNYPHPQPDLSVLPAGTSGDVVLDAVIDEHGRITALTLLKGLAPSVDQAVIATVKEWSFTPATRDGVPVPSEQELHFHYERG